MKAKQRKFILVASMLTGSLLFVNCEDTAPDTAPDSGTSTNLVFEEMFEGPAAPFSSAHNLDVGDWDYALQFVHAPVYKGSTAARFEIREDQELVANGMRSEVTIVKGSEGEIGANAWYSFAVYFPSDGYEYDDEREVINQWFQNGSPSTSLRTEEDKIILEASNNLDAREEIEIATITKDTWHTVVMHFIHSYNSDGLIEVWFDGEKVITRHGGNMYDDILPKWKIGLYKSAFKYNTSLVTKRVIYFDNVRAGNGEATFNDMRPER
jgi:hypothetical protein